MASVVMRGERPPVAFDVCRDGVDVFDTNNTWKKVARVCLDILSYIIFPVVFFRWIFSKIAVPGVLFPTSELDPYREQAHFEGIQLKRVAIKTADGVSLDTMTLTHNDSPTQPKNQKWILYFGGNGATYETSLEGLSILARVTGANVYCGNYRGVGHSEGSGAWSSQELVLDGEAMAQYLLSQGVPPENIMIHGHSLGGAIGAVVVAQHQKKGHEMGFCSDRSFSSTHRVAVNFGARVVDSCCGFPPCFGHVLGHISGGIATAIGWSFNPVEHYQKIHQDKRFMIFHRDDEVIDTEAQLREGLKGKHRQTEEIELGNIFSDPSQETAPYGCAHAIPIWGSEDGFLQWNLAKQKGEEIASGALAEYRQRVQSILRVS